MEENITFLSWFVRRGKWLDLSCQFIKDRDFSFLNMENQGDYRTRSRVIEMTDFRKQCSIHPIVIYRHMNQYSTPDGDRWILVEFNEFSRVSDHVWNRQDPDQPCRKKTRIRRPKVRQNKDLNPTLLKNRSGPNRFRQTRYVSGSTKKTGPGYDLQEFQPAIHPLNVSWTLAKKFMPQFL